MAKKMTARVSYRDGNQYGGALQADTIEITRRHEPAEEPNYIVKLSGKSGEVGVARLVLPQSLMSALAGALLAAAAGATESSTVQLLSD